MLIIDLNAAIDLLIVILYGLGLLRSRSIVLPELKAMVVALMFLWASNNELFSPDGMLALVTALVIVNVRCLEGIVLILIAYISQVYMIHSVDLIAFYISLELQNFVFMVLCARSAAHASVEAALKYLVLTGFSSGMLLYSFSTCYQLTGVMFRGVSYDTLTDSTQFIHSLLILAVVMFKLGAAPVHLWVVQVYGAVDRWLLFYVSTAPKIALFVFWVNAFQGIWTEYSLIAFSIISTVLGALGAYSQPRVRMLIAYSTLNEIGLLLSAAETAGFSNLYQHLAVYVTAQVLLWNLLDTRLFPLLSVSLAGLPPLAGFFGKSWIFWHLGTAGSNTLLITSLVFTVLSLIYYLRLVRLFYNTTNRCYPPVITVNSYYPQLSHIWVTSAAAILLVILPFVIVRPFIIA